jgi:hypothetical protein
VLGFLVQAGPKGAEESIFRSGFKGEHNSRLKFSQSRDRRYGQIQAKLAKAIDHYHRQGADLVC